MNKDYVVLVQPGSGLDEVVSVSEVTEFGEPLGIEYIAAYIEKFGYRARVIAEGNSQGNDKLIKEILPGDPFVVGFSAYTYNFNRALSLVQKLKQHKPNLTIVFGGYHPSGEPSIVQNTAIDYVVLGEGEHAFLQVINALAKGEDPSEVEGIAHWKDSIGLIPRRSRLGFKEIPWPKRDPAILSRCKSTGLCYPPPAKQRGMAQISYSRGCPFNCSFCSSKLIWGQKIVYRAVDDLLDEIEYLKSNFGTNLLFFTDLTFNVNRHRVVDLCEGIISRNLDVSWMAMVSPDIDDGLAAKMAEAHCVKLGFGIEALEEDSLSHVKPHQGYEKMKKTLEITDSVGILNRAYIMMGYPWETENTIKEEAEKLKELKIDQLRVSFITPYPGTQCQKEWQHLITTRDYDRYTSEIAVVRCQALSRSELLMLREWLVREFYSSREYARRVQEKITPSPSQVKI
jgi:radical SAM superfamily enzyme YgiQ (UPF0313 family)